jgi:hypothetical protein
MKCCGIRGGASAGTPASRRSVDGQPHLYVDHFVLGYLPVLPCAADEFAKDARGVRHPAAVDQAGIGVGGCVDARIMIELQQLGVGAGALADEEAGPATRQCCFRCASLFMRFSRYTSTLIGPTFQMSSQYSAMARSEENLPLRAALRIDMRDHASASCQAALTRAWQST